ncbi:MAG: hypothetical protein P8X57_08750 [Cyclobacteriaceae bacterium]
MKTTILLLAAAFALSYGAHAQTLDDQFQELKNNSYSYKEYKNIKLNELNSFWDVVQDSLKTKDNAYATAQGTIEAQNNKIEELNTTIDTQEAALEEGEFDAQHINVLGMDVGKESYKMVNTIVIIALLLILGVLFYQFKSSQKIAVAKKKDYDKLSEEFEEYKRNALEKQMKLRRELQTERNRIDEIRSA